MWKAAGFSVCRSPLLNKKYKKRKEKKRKGEKGHETARVSRMAGSHDAGEIPTGVSSENPGLAVFNLGEWEHKKTACFFSRLLLRRIVGSLLSLRADRFVCGGEAIHTWPGRPTSTF